MFKKWLRKPKTTQEKRLAYVEPQLVRAKRRPANLPSSRDDLWIKHEKNWKHETKFRKQWEKNVE